MNHLELRTHRRCAPIFFPQKGANLKSEKAHCEAQILVMVQVKSHNETSLKWLTVAMPY